MKRTHTWRLIPCLVEPRGFVTTQTYKYRSNIGVNRLREYRDNSVEAVSSQIHVVYSGVQITQSRLLSSAVEFKSITTGTHGTCQCYRRLHLSQKQRPECQFVHWLTRKTFHLDPRITIGGLI